MKIDLHTHTHYSDGKLSPKELIDLAIKRNVKYLSITDHDILTALPEAIEYSKDKPINFISGIEISCTPPRGKSIHIVGLYINPEDEKIKEIGQKILERKKQGFIDKIDFINKKLGVDMKIEDIKKRSQGQATFTHIAIEMINRRIFKDMDSAVKSLLKGGGFYIEKERQAHTSAEDAIKIIHKAGGVAILAHLAKYKNHNKYITEEEQEELVKELKGYGLDGLEVYIAESTESETKFVKNLANKYSLKISCGSDFHDEKESQCQN